MNHSYINRKTTHNKVLSQSVGSFETQLFSFKHFNNSTSHKTSR